MAIENVSVELKADDAVIDTLLPPPDSGDDGDQILGVGETWVWNYVVSITETTTFTATGTGKVVGLSNIITWPDYPERDQMKVEVYGPTRTWGFWKTHLSDVPPLDDTRYNLIEGGTNGQKGIHSGTDHQQAQGSGNTA